MSRRRGALSGSLSGLLAVLAAALSTSLAAGEEIPHLERKSGYAFMSRETRAMQDDDSTNPGMLWVLDGESLWNRKLGAADKACADCHGDALTSMKGVAARYPAFVPDRDRPLNLEGRINLCRADRQNATPLPYESKDLLALAAYVALQSRGLPISAPLDKRLEPYLQAGRDNFHARQGQLNLSCAQCHDDNWDRRLAGNPVTQGQATGYPLYRLDWQGLGSLQRRLRNCVFGMRAETYPLGAAEYINLELYLMWRARGMLFEAPAVRP